MNNLQGKTDLITGVVASAGIPAPFWVSFLDGTAKAAAILYSVCGTIYLIKKILRDGRK